MKAINRIIDRARANPLRIVLCEGDDPRILQAALRATREGTARIVLAGDRTRITRLADDEAIDLSGMELIDPADSPRTEAYAEELFRLREKGHDARAGAAGSAQAAVLRQSHGASR